MEIKVKMCPLYVQQNITLPIALCQDFGSQWSDNTSKRVDYFTAKTQIPDDFKEHKNHTIISNLNTFLQTFYIFHPIHINISYNL